MLSTAWLVRKRDITDPQYLTEHTGASQEDAEFIIKHVADGCRCHEEFLSIIKDKLSGVDHKKAS